MATPEAEPGLRTVSSASGSAPSVSVGRGVKSRGGAAKVGVCDAEGEKVYHLPTLCEAHRCAKPPPNAPLTAPAPRPGPCRGPAVWRGVKSRGGAAKVSVCDAEGEKVHHLPTLCEAHFPTLRSAHVPTFPHATLRPAHLVRSTPHTPATRPSPL